MLVDLESKLGRKLWKEGEDCGGGRGRHLGVAVGCPRNHSSVKIYEQ